MTNKQKKELKKILIAGVLFAALMILEHTHVLPQVFENRWLCLLVYLVPYCICGLSVLKKAVSGVRHKQMLDESFLMALASVGAFATGEAGEAAAVMLFYQVGEFFQSYAVGKSRRSISDLMDIAPEFANVEREDGIIETIDPDEVEINGILIIKPGEKIPVDGSVTEGESMVNTAALTGESVPRSVGPGSQIISGCINGNGLLKVRAEKIYEDSTVAKILELVESASEKKSRTENFITRFARWYTPIVVAGAILLAFIPPIFLGNFSTWIYRACTFLVISCPCALVISVPLAFFGGIGAASSKGVLVKGSNYLELLANIDTIVSDKTGTLTKGDFRVTKVLPAGDTDSTALLAIAAAAESMSTHPIAVSIQNAWQEHLSQSLSDKQLPEDNTAVSDASAGLTYRLVSEENITGKGISALLTGGKEDAQIRVLAGNASLLEDHSVSFTPVSDAASTVVYIAQDGAYIGAVLIRDEAKAEAADAIQRMKQEGVREAVMLTGDRTAVGEAVAKELGIDRVFAELLPQDKVTKVEEIISGLSGRKMGFIGDGINDAPVLSRADVGIAMGSMGSDAAIEAADVVIMDDNLLRIPDVMRVAKRTVGIARQNIVFALAVKIGILILGAFGIANMWAAVFADVGVAVICILNSMRLLAEKRTI